ncbi:MAG: phosphatidate cytidylyltransferase [Firmicutes bacterium]|nr:phosphatidate cytidylyltransferase [Bacillota bacterium]
MRIRIISGITGGILFLFLLIKGGALLSIAVGLLSLLATRELCRLFQKAGLEVNLPLAFFFTLLIMIGEAILRPDGSHGLSHGVFWELSFWALLFTSFLFSIGKGTTQGTLVSILAQVFVLLYPGLLFTYILQIRNLASADGWKLLLFAFAVIWGTDTGAYFIGSAWGRTPLAPRLSPHKTVEGAAGGLLVGTLTGTLVGSVLQLPLVWLLGAGLVTSFTGQLGDLFESFLKRIAGLKDSGVFLPGHGGVLDRFDSALLAMPVVYYLALFLLY